MELVPIIYNSLLVVFTLLSLVIIGSLICSKVFFCGQKKTKRVSAKQSKINIDSLSRTKPIVQREAIGKKEVTYRKSQPKIERKLIEYDQKFDLLIRTNLPPNEGIFYNRQIFDAKEMIHKLQSTINTN